MSGSTSPDGWRKSSLSGNEDCVEWRAGDDSVFVRDSKDPEGPVLTYSFAEWRAFLAIMKAG
jgi:hypothetical protein